jgi:predicted GNAT family N-acyltransferase
MNNAAPHVIAKQQDKVTGYALVMLPSFAGRIPVLYSLFERLNGICYNGKKLSEYKYYVMGQVCVAEEARGTGVFDKLYEKHKELYSGSFELCVTEVSLKNHRSARAHERIGFKSIHRYKDNTDDWDIIAWDFSP